MYIQKKSKNMNINNVWLNMDSKYLSMLFQYIETFLTNYCKQQFVTK